MSKIGFSKWRKLDNAALAFPAATDKKDTRVFRFFCQLKEEVNAEILQQALDMTMEKYPVFQAVLSKGLFWFYLEHRPTMRALVKKEEAPPCSRIYIPDEKSLLFEVSYHENRINLEVFHALTDGAGALQFLKQMVTTYLCLVHPNDHLPEEVFADEYVTGRDMEEDSFSHYYAADAPRDKEKKKVAYQLKGERLEQQNMRIMEIDLSVKDTLEKARSYGTTITILLATALMFAIQEEVPRSRIKKPISLMIPVNLRKFFPSQSMANFFGWIEVSYVFQDDTTFEQVLTSVKEQFKKELSKERISMRLNSLVRLEKNPLLRIIPLEVKQFFLHAGTTLGGRSITSVFSNVDNIKLSEEYSHYIEKFGAFASTDILQLCACSYGDTLVLGFTSKVPNSNIQRNFLRILQEKTLPYKVEENKFPGYGEQPRRPLKRAAQIITFVCIVAMIICGMTDYMLHDKLTWSLFVAGGVACAWIFVIVAIGKRRNVLKNLMWQWVIVVVVGLLWDRFTGWYGWSVNYLIPLSIVAVLVTDLILIWARHMVLPEYMYYILQTCAAGLLPLILLITKVVTVPYATVICSGICILLLLGLIIFKGKDVKVELQKKLHL